MPLDQLVQANTGRWTQAELKHNVDVLNKSQHQDDPLIQKCLAMYKALYQPYDRATA